MQCLSGRLILKRLRSIQGQNVRTFILSALVFETRFSGRNLFFFHLSLKREGLTHLYWNKFCPKGGARRQYHRSDTIFFYFWPFLIKKNSDLASLKFWLQWIGNIYTKVFKVKQINNGTWSVWLFNSLTLGKPWHKLFVTWIHAISHLGRWLLHGSLRVIKLQLRFKVCNISYMRLVFHSS
jgi:hypothetical protein